MPPLNYPGTSPQNGGEIFQRGRPIPTLGFRYRHFNYVISAASTSFYPTAGLISPDFTVSVPSIITKIKLIASFSANALPNLIGVFLFKNVPHPTTGPTANVAALNGVTENILAQLTSLNTNPVNLQTTVDFSSYGGYSFMPNETLTLGMCGDPGAVISMFGGFTIYYLSAPGQMVNPG
jgi:hypothetical protein